MCVSIPGRVVAIDGIEAQLDVLGARRKASTLMLPEVQVGDFVLTSAGMVVEIMDEDTAQSTIALFQELLNLEDEELTR
jgi:hydrogenase expression/formation protein HypC